MAVKKADALVEKGMAGIVLMSQHPLTGEPMEAEQFYTAANYEPTGPGMRTLYNELVGEDRKLHEAHGGKTPEQVIVELFAARCAEKGGEAFILKSLKNASDVAAQAVREAKVQTWREKLEKLNVQDKAKAAHAKIEAAEAALQAAKAASSKLMTDTAAKLDIEKGFDIALTKDGFYIPSETKSKSGSGTRTTVKRDWLAASEYTASGSINEVDYTAKAIIKDRDAEKPSRGNWTVTYQANGKSYKGEGKSLNAANKIARKKMIDVVAPGFKVNQNAPKDFGVPLVEAA